MNGPTPSPTTPKKPLSMDILFIGVISLIAVGSWVIFDVYRSLTVTTVPRVLQRQIRPLESQLDEELFADIKARRQFTETELNSVTPKPFIPLDERSSLAPTPSPTPTLAAPIASPTATLAPTPTATQSGEITL